MSDNQPATNATIEDLRRGARTAGIFFAIGVGSAAVFFFSFSSGGGGPDNMFAGLILIPILFIGGIVGIVSGAFWLVYSFALWQEKRALRRSTKMRESKLGSDVP